MPKRRKRIDNRQISLFEFLEQIQTEKQAQRNRHSKGCMNLKEPLRQSINRAIKASSLSRHQIAGEMSHLLSIEITKTSIDAWTAESKPHNRIPAEYLPAFCKVTRCNEPIEIINEAAGIFGLPGPDALRAEIQKYDEREKQARAEKRKRLLFLKEIENHNFKL